MKNFVTSMLIIVFVVVFCNGCSSFTEKGNGLELKVGDSTIKPFIGIMADAQFSSPPVAQVSNVPYDIRNVPIHNDDYGYPGVIEKNKADAPWLTEIRFLKAGVDVDLFDNVSWQTYCDLSLNYGHWASWGGDVNKRNYKSPEGNDNRGYGTALTFWTPNYDQLIPGLKTELHFNTDDPDNGFLIGAGWRRYGMQLVTGYDRYDKTDHKHHHKIGTIDEKSVYVGWTKDNGDTFQFIRIGLNFNNYDARSKYSQIDVDVNDMSYFASIGIGWRF